MNTAQRTELGLHFDGTPHYSDDTPEVCRAHTPQEPARPQRPLRGLEQARCICGWHSRAFRDGNLAKIRGEAHLGEKEDKPDGYPHHYEVREV